MQTWTRSPLLSRGSIYLIKRVARANLRSHLPKGTISLLARSEVSVTGAGVARCLSTGFPFRYSRSTLGLGAPIPRRCLSTGASTDIDPGWDGMFDALREYKSREGDTLVPNRHPDNPPLGKWVDRNRQLMRMRVEAEDEGRTHSPSHRILNDDRIERLNSIGFVWSQLDHVWDVRFAELTEYRRSHGDTLVPGGWPQNAPLAQWVLQQRRSHKLLQREGPQDELDNSLNSQGFKNESVISADRVKKLNDIGFVWDVQRHQWFRSFEELKVYIAWQGDALVPKVYPPYPTLSRWVGTQRLDYRRYIKYKKMDKELEDEEMAKEMKGAKRLATGMTEERIRLLEAEGFIWSVNDYVWESNYEELCTFVALNGHAALFSNHSKPYNRLARWADNQRTSYRKYKDGKKTALTEERIERLNAVHFIWGKDEK